MIVLRKKKKLFCLKLAIKNNTFCQKNLIFAHKYPNPVFVTQMLLCAS
jgi:hypothetical protein